MIKRRTLCVLMVLLVAVSALTGCSSGKTSQSAGEQTTSGLSRENRQEGTRRGTKDSGAQGDSSSQSQNQIIGKVTSIVGNEVELELGTMSGASGSSSGEFGAGRGNGRSRHGERPAGRHAGRNCCRADRYGDLRQPVGFGQIRLYHQDNGRYRHSGNDHETHERIFQHYRGNGSADLAEGSQRDADGR